MNAHSRFALAVAAAAVLLANSAASTPATAAPLATAPAVVTTSSTLDPTLPDASTLWRCHWCRG